MKYAAPMRYLLLIAFAALMSCATSNVQTRLENGVTVRYCDLHAGCAR